MLLPLKANIMVSRRDFIFKSMLTSAASLAPAALFSAVSDFPGAAGTPAGKPAMDFSGKRFTPGKKYGLGGVAAGNAFHVNSDVQIRQMLDAAWDAGVRYIDTSPWYGLGLSERRIGQFLHNKNREDYVLSSKIGRILEPDADFELPNNIWKGKLNFNYKYDYSAAGVRKSVEDSLHRMGLPYLDIVFIHDLSPDNGDMGENWVDYFEEARKGAMPELTRMRDEGLIKAWGFGVNRVEPILKAIEVADPDIFLSATQYSLIDHETVLNRLFPVVEERDISLVMGAPLNSGFLAGHDRYNYSNDIPQEFLQKRSRLCEIAKDHQVELRSAALQFCAAPTVVASVIPGASTAEQAAANVASMSDEIPADFWKQLKSEGLIAANAPEPNNNQE